MNTLIVPCAGHSSRYPGMRPKWLLTAPDGQLMLHKALSGMSPEHFGRIIITLVRRHDELHEATLILSQALPRALPVEICLLDDFTSCVAETVLLTLQRMQVDGPFAVKDCDNQVSICLPRPLGNHLVGYDLQRHPDTPGIPSKSFIIADEHGHVHDIVEKRVVSSMICVGLYCFAAPGPFIRACTRMLQEAGSGRELSCRMSSLVSCMRSGLTSRCWKLMPSRITARSLNGAHCSSAAPPTSSTWTEWCWKTAVPGAAAAGPILRQCWRTMCAGCASCRSAARS